METTSSQADLVKMKGASDTGSINAKPEPEVVQYTGSNRGRKTSVVSEDGTIVEVVVPEIRSAATTTSSDSDCSDYSGYSEADTLITMERKIDVGSTSNMQSMMHLLKGNIGTGILAMAYAMSNAGIWTGFCGLFFIGVVAIHCMHLLVKCSHKLCARTGRSSLDYGQVAEEAFATGPACFQGMAKGARVTINVFLCITQFGFCIVYVLFVAENIKQVIENYVDWQLNNRIYMVFVTLLLIPYSFVTNLRTLAFFSSLANFLTASGLIVILQYCFRNLKPAFYYPSFTSWSKLPLAFGTAIYAFEGIGVVLPIENKMRTPQAFSGLTGVLNTGMVIVTVLYSSIGFYGYLTFGNFVEGSITLNLPNDHWLYIGVKLVFALAIFLTYGLQFYVPAQILLEPLKHRLPERLQAHHVAFDRLGRVVFVIFTFCLAALIPHLDLMISLVGALASSTLALIFPPILEVLVDWPKMGPLKLKLFKDIFICVFGIIGFVAGTLVTLIEIIHVNDS